MRTVGVILVVCALATLGVCQYVDRVVASVDGRPILWSDVEEEVRVESLLQGVPLADITLKERNEALNRLIDASLLRGQIRQAHAMVDRDVLSKRETELETSIRAQRNAASSDMAWQKLLKEYGLTQSDLDEHLKEQVQVLDFIDLRFRSGVQVSPEEIRRYYNEEFVPDMRKRGAQPPALDAVRPQIERILLERGVSEAMDEWLKAVRGQADIWRAQPFASMSAEDKARG